MYMKIGGEVVEFQNSPLKNVVDAKRLKCDKSLHYRDYCLYFRNEKYLKIMQRFES